jgi:hypothetical protein
MTEIRYGPYSPSELECTAAHFRPNSRVAKMLRFAASLLRDTQPRDSRTEERDAT